MPYLPHHRLTFSGVLGTVALPIEEWSWNLRIGGFEGLGDSIIPGLATQLRTLYTTHVAPMMPNDVILTRVRAATVNEAGHVYKAPDGSYVQQDDTTQVIGSGAARQMPSSSALCVSLVTARGGASGKGRFFLPAPAFDINAGDKRYTAPNMQTVAQNVEALVVGINAIAGVGKVSVESTKALSSPVIRIRVGRRPDVLRSRSRSVPESYELSDVIA